MSLETKLDREFRKDFKKLKETIASLIEESPLDKNLLNRQLKGNWFGYRECHIKPDWLLVYKVDKESNTLNLARIGTHNQIFNK